MCLFIIKNKQINKINKYKLYLLILESVYTFN